ncbi:MAG: hypothetical protein HC916_14405 [Coleofasciculaceae cyanobacterium SM2_1_6]|nr:hypothetical protein [Coleofasciculaceae cyanobacterium SM2_1_6]
MARQNYGHPVGFYLSVATLPAMGALVMATALKEVVTAVGLASEEVFRGDRLPLLKKPKSSPTPVTPST